MRPQLSNKIVPRIANKLRATSQAALARGIEAAYLPLDKALMRRNRNLGLVPSFGNRRGGKVAYGEWCWLIGLFQTLIHDLVADIESPRIVDVGCGTGLAMIAAQPSVAEGGELIGLDLRAEDIEFCRSHYTDPSFRFIHLEAPNAFYAPDGQGSIAWPIEDASVDLVTAISVWTHLQMIDAQSSLNEAARVVRPGGHALISLFLVDPSRQTSPRPAQSKFHRTAPDRWRFNTSVGDGWFSPSWATPPERAIGLTREVLFTLTTEAGFEVVKTIGGTWSEQRGLYFQDVVVLRRIEQDLPAKEGR